MKDRSQYSDNMNCIFTCERLQEYQLPSGNKTTPVWLQEVFQELHSSLNFSWLVSHLIQ
uniref:Uncharacterized protein n=1 Tax=Arundo donax TaxID=35708 RepID=A0A0A9HAB6_ARUDO